MLKTKHSDNPVQLWLTQTTAYVLTVIHLTSVMSCCFLRWFCKYVNSLLRGVACPNRWLCGVCSANRDREQAQHDIVFVPASCNEWSLCFSHFSFSEWEFFYTNEPKRDFLPISLSSTCRQECSSNCIQCLGWGVTWSTGSEERGKLGRDFLLLTASGLARTDFWIAIWKWWLRRYLSLIGK